MNYRGGLPRGAGLKKVKITLPGAWQGFAQWLLQVNEVRDRWGVEMAEEFVKESNRRYKMTKSEMEFAMSIARTK